jgi:hypothetical protein
MYFGNKLKTKRNKTQLPNMGYYCMRYLLRKGESYDGKTCRKKFEVVGKGFVWLMKA